MSKKSILTNINDLVAIVWVPIWKVQECFQPIVASRSDLIEIASGRAMKKQNICGFFVSCYLILDTLYYVSLYGYDPANPMIYQHITVSFMPVFVRMQNDIVVIGGFFFTFICTLVSSLHHMEHVRKVVLYPEKDGVLGTLDGQTMSRSLSRKLLTFWKRVKPRLDYIGFFFEICLHAAYAIPHTVGGLYKLIVDGEIVPRFWFMGTCCIIFHHYCICVAMSANMFVVTNIFLNIKQRYYLDEIRFDSYSNFQATLKTLQGHTAEIGRWDRFFRPFISAILYAFCFVSGSLLHSSINTTGVNPLLKFPWLFMGCFSASVVPMYTMAGSKTSLLNRKLYFKLRAQQISLCSLKKLFFRRRIVRLDLMNEYKIMLLKPCFRLVTSSPLNNKYLVFELLGVLSVAYMKIISRSIV